MLINERVILEYKEIIEELLNIIQSPSLSDQIEERIRKIMQEEEEEAEFKLYDSYEY